ncbi:MAG: hypothetical protein R3D71_00020 [Rickettsiales bacterium]
MREGYRMVTMREAVAAYEKRYYDGKGGEIASNSGIKVEDYQIHDMYHLIASGALKISDNHEVVSGIRKLENSDLVDRAMGVKAEILSAIYLKVFEDIMVDQNRSFQRLKNSDFIKEQFDIAKSSIDLQMKDSELNYKQSYKIDYHDNKFVNKLYESYNEYRGKVNSSSNVRKFKADININDFISDEEIEFHRDKAENLFYSLRQGHPEFFINSVNEGALLDLDIKEFTIDNFMATEKEKLKKISKNNKGIRI